MWRSFFLVLLFLVLARDTSAGKLYLVTRATDEHVKIPHAGCVVVYDNGSVSWLHFGIKDVGRDLLRAVEGQSVPGEIRRNEFTISRMVGVSVPDEVLNKAVAAMEKSYENQNYKWIYDAKMKERDCVTFASAMCRECGVNIGDASYDWPIMLLAGVQANNKVKNEDKGWDLHNRRGFVPPWKK